MIERICPKCKVPMSGEKCIKPSCGCNTVNSSTIYWCSECQIPTYNKICPLCGSEGKYIATDARPVFPEENLLISLLLSNDPRKYERHSVWYGSGAYIIDGKKVKLSVSKVNSLDIAEIKEIRRIYDANATKIDYTYFDMIISKFVEANKDRYNYITEEAVNFIQSYKEKYDISDMMVSFSGGKDSTVGYDEKEYTTEQLMILAKNKERNITIINKLRELSVNNIPTIVFACSVEHAKMISAMLTLDGISNSLVLGNMNEIDRKKAIEQFKDRSSGVDIIINYEVLTTGFDSKNIKCVFITRPTKSIVLYSQMLGRGLRGPLMGGNEECLLIDVDDNLNAFDNETAFNHFNDYWRI